MTFELYEFNLAKENFQEHIMFTGIIESIAVVEEVTPEGTNKNFILSSAISHELKVDQSVCHNGVCLTVTKTEGGKYWVSAINETLEKSNLGQLVPGSVVNIERSMLNNGRFDGHIVQGHVDQVGTVKSIKDLGGSWALDLVYDPSLSNITVEKGSICVNGVSLTCFNSSEGAFSVAIIPYTYSNTNLGKVKAGATVNLEFDIVGKYIRKLVGK